MNISNSIFAGLIVLAISACSGDGDVIVDEARIDFSGSWVGACELADTSLVPDIGEVYYYDVLEITDTRIATDAFIFADSDCISPFEANYARNVLFDEGDYTVGSRVITDTGLTAFALEIQDTQSDTTVENLIALIDGTLYFGYSLFDGPMEADTGVLTTLDLNNGYRKR